MAEIKIEKKKPIWPWILAALAVLLILWLIFSGTGNDDMEDVENTTDTTEVENTWASDTLTTNNNNSNEVNSYVTFVRTDSDERMGLQHNYTETALTRLADAVEAKANDANVDVQQEMDRVDGVADYMTEDTYQTQHADSLRVAFQQINSAVEKISQNQNSSVDIEGLRSSAEAVKPGQQTLEQKDAVRSYFDKAANVLQEMDRNMAGNNRTNQNNQMNQNTTTTTTRTNS